MGSHDDLQQPAFCFTEEEQNSSKSVLNLKQIYLPARMCFDSNKAHPLLYWIQYYEASSSSSMDMLTYVHVDLNKLPCWIEVIEWQPTLACIHTIIELAARGHKILNHKF